VISALFLVANAAHRLHCHAVGLTHHSNPLDRVTVAGKLRLAKLVLRLRLSMLARRKVKLAWGTDANLTWLLEAFLGAFLARDVRHTWHVLLVSVNLRASSGVLGLEIRRLRRTRCLVLARQLVWIMATMVTRTNSSVRIEIVRAHTTRWVEESASEVLR